MIRFGSFQIDPRTWLLTDDGRAVDLSPRLVEILAHIVSREGQIVTMRDGRIDGFVKGAIFGTALGFLTMQAYERSGDRGAALVGSAVVYGGIGYVLDAAQTHREPLYCAAAAGASKPAMKLSLRF